MTNRKVIYSKFITLKNGRRLIASHYGLKAFRFVVKDKSEDRQEATDTEDQD